ncbi:DUF5008 domain-containing protein [Chitinophaga silvatica]|uniref:DUF5008 domain-containing protein n=1 Tax=Chitinophaga silvatica TaxID=2282649 RepID=A0A3E1YEV1_9BACT|nr:IPT/TIG domain-containing protein [Chitinophaga silvatica]RFS25080.1 DUF5008 domain-containing protein [Chitinophaga silvatica]
MKKYIYFYAFLIGCFTACTKDAVKSSGENPYGDQVQPAITLKKDGLNPTSGKVGDVVTLGGKNFLKNKDQISFLFNNVKAEVVELTDTTAKLKVPGFAATGNITVLVNQEYYYGPFFRVNGVFEMVTDYPGTSQGANGYVADIIPISGNKYLMVGNFNRYGSTDNSGKGMKSVVRVKADGTWDQTFANGMVNGCDGTVTSGYELKNTPYYLVAGSFSSFATVANCNSIAAIYASTGGLVTDKVINNVTHTEYTTSALKGGLSGSIYKMDVIEGADLKSTKVLAVGKFRFFVQPNYQLLNYQGLDSVHLDSVQVSWNIARLNGDGTLDSTFNYDLVNHRGNPGPNDFIATSLLLPDGKILIAGGFTTYNGQPANRIARLNPDGSLDNTFSSAAGPDLEVTGLTRQPDGKIILVGNFNTYGGAKAPRVTRINADGAVDPSFNVGLGTEDAVVHADLMPGGEIILNGTFIKFGQYYRNGFIVLNPDGSPHPTYNTTGGLTFLNGSFGLISKIIPVEGEKSLLMVGSLTNFDYRTVQRLVKIKYQ